MVGVRYLTCGVGWDGWTKAADGWGGGIAAPSTP